MLQLGAKVGAGTDATRVASFNPNASLYWLVSGRTVGGLQLYGEENRMSREEALRLYTQGSSWFSTEEDVKGSLAPGQLADFAVLSDDILTVPEQQIPQLKALATYVGGRQVYRDPSFSD